MGNEGTRRTRYLDDSPGERMRAVVLDHSADGDSVTVVRDVPTPRPAAHEVIVQVKAVGISRSLDLEAGAKGNVSAGRARRRILGQDPSGVISAIGPGVNSKHLGEAVIVMPNIACGHCDQCVIGLKERCPHVKILGVHCDGGWAEFVKVPLSNTYPKPGNISFAQASTLAVSYATAWHLLVRRAEVKPTDTVLIQGASGALGVAGIQVARLHGAKVIAVVGSDSKRKQAEAVGATSTINHRDQDLARTVVALTDGFGATIAYDNVGAATFAGSLASLAAGGRLVVAGTHGGSSVEVDLRRLYLRQQGILGASGRSASDIVAVAQLAAHGRLNPVVDSVYPLESVIEAQQRMKNRAHFGKVLLAPSGVSGANENGVTGRF